MPVSKGGREFGSDRVIEETGAPIVSSLHFWYELMLQRGNDGFIQDDIRAEWEDYKAYVDGDAGGPPPPNSSTKATAPSCRSRNAASSPPT